MADRIMTVNAYTTFDLVDASAEGHGFEERAYGTLNVRTRTEGQTPTAVLLELELDNTQLDALPTHADRVTLSPDEARTLAAELERYATRVEEAAEDDDD